MLRPYVHDSAERRTRCVGPIAPFPRSPPVNVPLKAQTTLAERPEATVVAILVAASVCHCLNDTIQSLLPAIYPMLKDDFQPRLRPDRPDHPRLPGHRLAAAAGRRPLHRPPAAALFAARRHGLHPDRPAAALGRADLSGCCSSPPAWSASARRSSTRNPRASRAWPRAAGTASRSRSSRSAAMSARRSGRCSPPSSSCRSARQHRLVLGHRAGRRWSILWQVGRWYRDHRRMLASRPARAGTAGSTLPRRTVVIGADRVLALLIFSKYFYLVEPVELLHLLPDRAVRRLGAGVAAPSLRLPRWRRRRHVIGGPIGDRFGRKYVIWVSILGVLPFTLALPYADLSWTGVLSRDHRPHPLLGLLGHRRLRAGAGARPGRHDLRHVLRPRLRHGRPRRRRARRARRPHQHRASSTRSARSCRRSACSPSSCRTSNGPAGAPECHALKGGRPRPPLCASHSPA